MLVALYRFSKQIQVLEDRIQMFWIYPFMQIQQDH